MTTVWSLLVAAVVLAATAVLGWRRGPARVFRILKRREADLWSPLPPDVVDALSRLNQYRLRDIDRQRREAYDALSRGGVVVDFKPTRAYTRAVGDG